MDDLNDRQKEAIGRVLNGESIVITGAPGTGKTTTVQELLVALLPITPLSSFRDPMGGTDVQETKVGIACIAMTNRAVNNMYASAAKNKAEIMDDPMQPLGIGNFLTAYKLLEYAPVFFWSEEKSKETMRFDPKRDEYNKLPEGLIIIIEEASTMNVQFSNLIADALIAGTIQVVFLGDINQMAPVFGDSILNYALRKLHTVELTHVYRQALESPIIRQAHRILKGIPPANDTETEDTTGVVLVHNLNKRMGDVAYGKRIGNAIQQLNAVGKYDAMEDMILTPYNVGGCGSIELNNLVASHLDDLKVANDVANCTPYTERHKVYEIIAGYTRAYYAVGDRVYDSINKSDGIITEIRKNGEYFGKIPQEASPDMSRTGVMKLVEGQPDPHAHLFSLDKGIGEGSEGARPTHDYAALDLSSASMQDVDDRVTQSSHVIEISPTDGSPPVTRGTSGELNALALGYCLTMHKAQGCEWPRVIIAVHHKHTQCFREGLYTALTRAKTDCFIFTDLDKTMTDIMKRQRIKGNTLEEKIQSFNQKLEDRYNVAKLQGQEVLNALPKARLLDCIRPPHEEQTDW